MPINIYQITSHHIPEDCNPCLSVVVSSLSSFISAFKLLTKLHNLLKYKTGSRPPLWSSCQSSWLQIQRSGFDSRHYQFFREVVGLERGPLSLVSTIEELLGRKTIGSGVESWEYGRREPSCWPRGTFIPQKLALTPPTDGGRSVGIVRLWTQVMEFSFFYKTGFPQSSTWKVRHHFILKNKAKCFIVRMFLSFQYCAVFFSMGCHLRGAFQG
jgi:hypothetical protein